MAKSKDPSIKKTVNEQEFNEAYQQAITGMQPDISGSLKAKTAYSFEPMSEPTISPTDDVVWTSVQKFTVPKKPKALRSTGKSIIGNDVKLLEDASVIQEVRDSLEIKFEPSHTVVHLVVIAKNEKLNTKKKIRCAGCTSIKGYIYDANDDCYIVNCCYSTELGIINQIAHLTVPKTGDWRICIPLPDSVLEKCLSNSQRKILKEIQQKFPSDDYEINYVQMIDVWN
jgi:hypothetical protein